MKLSKPNSITVMGLMPITAFGITMVIMKYRKARQILIRLKVITLNCVTIWLDWHAARDVFQEVSKLWSGLCELFVYCFNRRQLLKQRFPSYPAHVFQFV